MNVKLLKRVRDRIAARPRQFVMRALFDDKTESREPVSHCGTAACIAGWTYTLKKRTTPDKASKMGCRYELDQEYVDTWIEAELALCINRNQARRLFLAERWPQPFLRDFENATDASDHAAIAVRRINHFIKTKGKE